MDINKITLLGRIGQEPVLSYTASGKALLKFSVATGVSWKKEDGEWETKTSWHNIQAWGKSAEYLSAKLARGIRVYLEGSISYSKFEKDGVTQYYTAIVADKVIPLSHAEESRTTNTEPTRPEEGFNSGAQTNEEPF